MKSPNQLTRDFEQRIGIITDVDLSNNKVFLQDKYQGLIQISMHANDPVLVVPQVGELWMVRRQGIDWLLEKRLESGTEKFPLSNLKAGDRRLEAAGGTIYLASKGITINGDLIKIDSPKFTITGKEINLNSASVTVNGIPVLTETGATITVTNSGVTSYGPRNILNLISGSNINFNIQDDPTHDRINIQFNVVVPRTCTRLRNLTNQSIAGDSSWNSITFDTQDFDVGTLHDTTINTSRITSVMPGIYFIHAFSDLSSSASVNARLLINNTTVIALVAANNNTFDIQTNYSMGMGDYVEVQFQSTSGGKNTVATSPRSPVFELFQIN